MREVAAEAGVSVSTVSNVLNNRAVVASATRERVEQAMDRVGFVRNGPARQLRGVPSPMVGAVILDLANPFYGEVTRGIEDRLAEAGCTLLMCSTDARPDKESRHLRVLEEHGVRGVLLTPVGPRFDGVREIIQRGTPVVLLDHAGLPEVCSVTVDNALGAHLAVGHLLSLGHRRIAFFQGDQQARSEADRRRGVLRALAEAGLDPARALRDVRLPSSGGAEAAEEALEEVLSATDATDAPTAIFCLNDLAALGVVRGLRRRGIAVPGEISVVGYDDVHFAAELSPALTTVRQPKYELGRTAADLLLDEGGARHRHRHKVFRPQLVIRDSTGPPGR